MMVTFPEKYVYPFVDLTNIVVLGIAHTLRTADLVVQVYDSAGIAVSATHRVHPDTYDVFITVLQPMSGRVVLLG